MYFLTFDHTRQRQSRVVGWLRSTSLKNRRGGRFHPSVIGLSLCSFTAVDHVAFLTLRSDLQPRRVSAEDTKICFIHSWSRLCPHWMSVLFNIGLYLDSGLTLLMVENRRSPLSLKDPNRNKTNQPPNKRFHISSRDATAREMEVREGVGYGGNQSHATRNDSYGLVV